MFDVPSGVRFATVATTLASVLGSLRAGTATRTKAQRASLSETGRRTGVDGTKAGLTGPGTATPWIESRPNLSDGREAAAEGDPCEEGEREVKAPTTRTEAMSTEATANAAMRAIR
jgi:hypothetical protein